MVYIRLIYVYSVISVLVNDKRLPGNNKKWTLVRSWLIRVRSVHSWAEHAFILQAPPNLHPFVLEGLVRTKTFFTLLLGLAYSVSTSESSSRSEVRNYDHHRWENKPDSSQNSC